MRLLSIMVIMGSGLWLLGGIHAQSTSKIRDLRIQERVEDMLLLDLNRDGFLDLASMTKDANGNSHFFWAAGSKTGIADDRKSINLGPGVVGVDIADYTGDGIPELIRWTDSGIDALTLPKEDGKSKTLKLMLPAESKLSKIKRWVTTGSGRFVKLFYDFGSPLGRGFLAPLVGEFDIWSIARGMANHQVRLVIPERNHLAVTGNGDIPDSWFSIRRPAGWVIDLDRDSDLDLLFFDDERILSFTNNEGYTANPSQVLIVRQPGTDSNPLWKINDYYCVDINRDRYPDLIRSQTNAYSYGIESLREIYLCREGGAFSTKPDLVHKVPRFEEIQAVVDLDGDGYDELVVSSIPGGTVDFIKTMDGNKLDLAVDVYVYQDNGYPKKPAYTVRGILLYPFMTIPRCRISADGDFNGDGKLDLLVPFGEEFRIYWNKGKTVFTDKDHTRVPIVPSENLVVADINGDGKTDIVSSHPTSGWGSVIQTMIAGY